MYGMVEPGFFDVELRFSKSLQVCETQQNLHFMRLISCPYADKDYHKEGKATTDWRPGA